MAYEKHPERFVKGPPEHPTLPEAVWINPPPSRKKGGNWKMTGKPNFPSDNLEVRQGFFELSELEDIELHCKL